MLSPDVVIGVPALGCFKPHSKERVFNEMDPEFFCVMSDTDNFYIMCQYGICAPTTPNTESPARRLGDFVLIIHFSRRAFGLR